jgi:photosystem II stability/assembly factor-like uncharacterized protein
VPAYRTISSLAFVDALHGWALETATCEDAQPCPLVLHATTDGGQTWQAVAPSRGGQGALPWIRDVGSIRFTTARDGWAFGPRLFTTHDGGQTWTDVNWPGQVWALEPQGESAWAIEQACPESAPCTFTLRVSRDLGQTWQAAPVQPPSAGQLVRPTANDAWILAPESLAATHNGGMTWTTLPKPTCAAGDLDSLAALPSGQLWLLRVSLPAAGTQLKSLCLSPDGGAHWSRVASGDPTDLTNLGNLPVDGYAAGLAVSTAQRAWIPMNRGLFYTTGDGGQTWQPVPGIGDPTSVRLGPVLFLDASHGWVGWAQDVYHTTDGGTTWTGASLP